MRRGLLILMSFGLMAHPARAQLVVIDPANLIEAVAIAERAQRHYQQLMAQYQTIQRMSKGLGSLEGYRVPALSPARHELAPWSFGRPWLTAFNAGDPSGAGYWATTIPLQVPGALPTHMSAAARQTFERHYATVEISDSVATLGAHQVGALRGYHGQLQSAVEALEADVMSGLLRYHEATAILDKIAAGPGVRTWRATSFSRMRWSNSSPAASGSATPRPPR